MTFHSLHSYVFLEIFEDRHFVLMLLADNSCKECLISGFLNLLSTIVQSIQSRTDSTGITTYSCSIYEFKVTTLVVGRARRTFLAGQLPLKIYALPGHGILSKMLRTLYTSGVTPRISPTMSTKPILPQPLCQRGGCRSYLIRSTAPQMGSPDGCVRDWMR